MKADPEEEIEVSSPINSNIILELIQYTPEDYAHHDNVKCETLLKRIKEDHVNWINLDGLERWQCLKSKFTHKTRKLATIGCERTASMPNIPIVAITLCLSIRTFESCI